MSAPPRAPRFGDGLVGIVLDGRYRLDAVLGEGGMGSVFRAQHLAMDRRVAVKLLKPHLATDERQLERFVREARSTQRVDSPHAVKVLDFGITPGPQRDYYMVLEYLDGRTVQRELEVDGPFAPARAVHVIRQALHALAAAHAIGLVHRDLKPDNILLMREGDDPDYTKLLDFGVAKLMDGAEGSSRSVLALTQQGMVFGTPEFMSPEQACGHPLDGRSDLYSLAATLFAMVTGCALFEAVAPIEWLTHHVRTPPPNLAMVNPSLAAHGELDALIQRCLAKRREDRPASAGELDRLLAAIEPTLSGGPATPVASVPARATARTTMFSSSTFIPALPIVTPPTATTGAVAVPAGRSRVLIIAALLVVGVIVAAIAVASRGHTRTAALVASPRDAGRPGDAMVPVAVVDAPPAIDAAAPPAIDAGVRVVVTPAVTNEHLRNAEEAQRGSNRLRQLAEADLALRADPRSTRAKFLLGDALVATGDLDRGCKYLRALARYQPAQTRARAAGCP